MKQSTTEKAPQEMHSEKKRYINWMGQLEITYGPDKKPVSYVFKKTSFETKGAKGASVTPETIQILNMGFLSRPGIFHSLWLPDTEENRKWDPIQLNPADFTGPEY